MTQEKDNGRHELVASEKKSRQDRLKLALRENLKRRKSQARGRAPSEIPEASLDDAGGKSDD